MSSSEQESWQRWLTAVFKLRYLTASSITRNILSIELYVCCACHNGIGERMPGSATDVVSISAEAEARCIQSQVRAVLHKPDECSRCLTSTEHLLSSYNSS